MDNHRLKPSIIGASTGLAVAPPPRKPTDVWSSVLLVSFTAVIASVLSAGPVFGYYLNNLGTPPGILRRPVLRPDGILL